MPERELTLSSRLDFDGQLKEMSVDEIWEQLLRENAALGELGVKKPIHDIIYGAQRYVYDYEISGEGQNRRPRVTPMNCLMSLYDTQPGLIRRADSQHMTSLAETISRLAHTTEALFQRYEQSGDQFEWLEPLTQSPQEALKKQ